MGGVLGPSPRPPQTAGPPANDKVLRQLRVAEEYNRSKVISEIRIDELKTKATEYLINGERANLQISKTEIKVRALNDENIRLNKTIERMREKHAEKNAQNPVTPAKNNNVAKNNGKPEEKKKQTPLKGFGTTFNWASRGPEGPRGTLQGTADPRGPRGPPSDRIAHSITARGGGTAKFLPKITWFSIFLGHEITFRGTSFFDPVRG